MVALERSTPYTPWPAGRANAYAAEIERVATGVFGSVVNLAAPLVSVSRTSVFNVSNTLDTVVPWQTADEDPNVWWDPSVPTRLTCRTPGLYICIAQVRYPSTTAVGVRNSLMLKNGTSPGANSFANQSQPGSTSGAGPTLSYAKKVRLLVGEWLALNVYQTSGGTMALQTDFGGTTFDVFRIGP